MKIRELKKFLDRFDENKNVYLKDGTLTECYKAYRVSGDNAGSVVLLTLEQVEEMKRE